MDCPFCGAKPDKKQQGWKAFYLCKTGQDTDGTFYRGAICYEAQIRNLQTTLRQAGEMVKVFINPEYFSKDSTPQISMSWNYECIYCEETARGNPELIRHKESCPVTKAAALLPEIERLVGEKP
jgi:hypothetical protein